MKKIALIPIIIFLEFYTFSYVTELLTLPSDFGVLLGVLALCVLIILNYYLFKYVFKQINKQINKQKP